MLEITVSDDLTNLDNASCKFYLKDAADYAIRPLDDRLARMQCPKRTKRVAFFFVLFTYFGVSYLLGGLHSYAGM